MSRLSLLALAAATLVVGCSGAQVRTETEPDLESMAKLATEDLIERMLDPRATDRIMVPALSVLQEAEQLPKSALPKLRAALRVELAANKLSEPEDCSYAPCRPRLAYLVELAGLWKREASALEPELLDAWRWKDARVAQEARSALAATGAPKVLPVLLRALQGESLLDAQQAASDLSRFASIAPLREQARRAVNAIEHQLSRAPEPYVRGPFLRALGAIGDERALSVLQAELLQGVADATTAAEELAKLGPAAATALPDLHTLADTHWETSTRRAAAKAVSAITGEPFEAAPLRCPTVREAEGSYLVPLAERVLAMKRVEGQVALTERCREVQSEMRSIASFDDGRACLLSFSRGEFGGWTNIYDPAHEPYHLPDTQALRFVQVGDRLLVIHGLEHGIGTGWITTLKRARDGRWAQALIANMMAYPIGFAVEGDRLLLLVKRVVMKAGDCKRLVVALDPRNRLSIVQ